MYFSGCTAFTWRKEFIYNSCHCITESNPKSQKNRYSTSGVYNCKINATSSSTTTSMYTFSSTETVDTKSPIQPTTPDVKSPNEIITTTQSQSSNEPITPDSTSSPNEPITPDSASSPNEPIPPDSTNSPNESITPESTTSPNESITPESTSSSNERTEGTTSSLNEKTEGKTGSLNETAVATINR